MSEPDFSPIVDISKLDNGLVNQDRQVILGLVDVYKQRFLERPTRQPGNITTSLQQIGQRLSDYGQQLWEQEAGAEYKDVYNEKQEHEVISLYGLEESDGALLLDKSKDLVDSIRGTEGYKFTNRYEMMGALLASLVSEDTDIGIDQRKLLTAFALMDRFKLGALNYCWNNFVSSEQSETDLVTFVFQVFAQEHKVITKFPEIVQNVGKSIDIAVEYLQHTYPNKDLRLPNSKTIMFFPTYSLEAYPIKGNTAANSDESVVAGGMANDLLLPSEVNAYFLVSIPDYNPNDPVSVEQAQRDAVRITLHENLHESSKDLGSKHELTSGSPEEIALEAITDYASILLYVRSQGEDADFIESQKKSKVGYPPYLKLIDVFKREDIFGEGAFNDDQIMDMGLDQDLGLAIKRIDSLLKTLPNPQSIIDELDRILIIGPKQYEDLSRKRKITFNDIASAMLQFRQEIGSSSYNYSGRLLRSMVAFTEKEEWPLKDIANYYLGSVSAPITSEIRTEKHLLITSFIEWRQEKLANQESKV